MLFQHAASRRLAVLLLASTLLCGIVCPGLSSCCCSAAFPVASCGLCLPALSCWHMLWTVGSSSTAYWAPGILPACASPLPGQLCRTDKTSTTRHALAVRSGFSETLTEWLGQADNRGQQPTDQTWHGPC
jgi:hypothetical protein